MRNTKTAKEDVSSLVVGETGLVVAGTAKVGGLKTKKDAVMAISKYQYAISENNSTLQKVQSELKRLNAKLKESELAKEIKKLKKVLSECNQNLTILNERRNGAMIFAKELGLDMKQLNGTTEGSAESSREED